MLLFFSAAVKSFEIVLIFSIRRVRLALGISIISFEVDAFRF